MVKSTANLPMEAHTVLGFEDVFPGGYVDQTHSHEHSQLAFSLSGVMSVIAGNASFVLPPDRAIWIPGNTPHQVSCRGEMRFQVVYVHPGAGELPVKCRVFEVSPLLRGLIHEVTRFGHGYDEHGREGRIVQMLLDEIVRMPDLNVRAVMPDDPRLARVCQAIVESPSDQRDLDEWASYAGMGRRTFTRLFRQQTGMGLGTWRQQVRLMEAVSRLSTGEAITSVAYEVGYDSPSAFAAMFHRSFGVPPREYRKPS